MANSDADDQLTETCDTNSPWSSALYAAIGEPGPNESTGQSSISGDQFTQRSRKPIQTLTVANTLMLIKPVAFYQDNTML